MAISHKILGFAAISIFDIRLIITNLRFQTHLPSANQVSVSIMFGICCFYTYPRYTIFKQYSIPHEIYTTFIALCLVWSYWKLFCLFVITSSNGNIFRVTEPMWIPHTKASDAELRFSLICPRKNGWVNNAEAGYLRRHRAHYDVIVMSSFEFAEASMA